MVRTVKLSSDCPRILLDHDSLFDDEFNIVDDWKSGEQSPSDTSMTAGSHNSPRNLAGAAADKPVAIKSRRQTRGRRSSKPGPAAKQISVFLPFRDWRLLRDEAARQRIPIAEVARRWFRPHLDQLAETHGDPTEVSS